eukprot:1486133-Pyramimonas_sp.AAC.1
MIRDGCACATKMMATREAYPGGLSCSVSSLMILSHSTGTLMTIPGMSGRRDNGRANTCNHQSTT